MFPFSILLNQDVDVVTLSGHSNSAGNSGSAATASFKIDNDGFVYEKDNLGAWLKIDSVTDWVRPVESAPGDYECRYTSATGDTGDLTPTTAEDVWHPLATSDWTIIITDDNPLVGGKSATFTLEIRKGSSGGAIASGSYTLTADREDS